MLAWSIGSRLTETALLTQDPGRLGPGHSPALIAFTTCDSPTLQLPAVLATRLHSLPLAYLTSSPLLAWCGAKDQQGLGRSQTAKLPSGVESSSCCLQHLKAYRNTVLNSMSAIMSSARRPRADSRLLLCKTDSTSDGAYDGITCGSLRSLARYYDLSCRCF